MKILAIDSSGLVASAAVVQEDRVLAELTVNNKKNHSATLLPMIDEIFKLLDIEPAELDAVAVAKGPGSFTGLRIGSATAKGIALALEKPVVEISSLEAMAYQLHGVKELICPIMDARRDQVYAGLYKFEGGELKSVMPDEALSIDELVSRLNGAGEAVTFLGDGVPAFSNRIKEDLRTPFEFAMMFQNRQRAAALGALAVKYYSEGRTVPGESHRPVYLRLSQAERERLERGSA